jgi:hypothetical protein
MNFQTGSCSIVRPVEIAPLVPPGTRDLGVS